MKHRFLVPLTALVVLPLLISFKMSATIYKWPETKVYSENNYIMRLEDVKYDGFSDGFKFTVYCKNLGDDYIDMRSATMNYFHVTTKLNDVDKYSINPFSNAFSSGYIAPDEEYTCSTFVFRSSTSKIPSTAQAKDFETKFSVKAFPAEDVLPLELYSYEFNLYRDDISSYLNVDYQVMTREFQNSFFFGRIVNNDQTYFDFDDGIHEKNTLYSSLFRYSVAKDFSLSDDIKFSIIAIKKDFDNHSFNWGYLMLILILICFLPLIMLVCGLIVLYIILKRMKEKREKQN